MGAHAPGTEPLIHGGGGGGRGRGGCCRNAREFFWNILPAILGALAALVVAAPLLYWANQLVLDDTMSPEFTVAVAGFSGLDVRGGAAPLDPAFDLTVRITEPRRWDTACVPRGTTAVVSYRRVRLASGPVPGFCGENGNANGTEVGSVMAWGTAVPVPRFARDQLAGELARGEAAVDVTLVGPARYCAYCHQQVVECKARLGRGEASPPCNVRYDTPALPDGSGKRLQLQQQARKELRTRQDSSE